MKLLPITYRIMIDNGESIEVYGLAVDAKCKVRICVRNVSSVGIYPEWVADHYDTGYRIIGKGVHRTPEDAANAAVSIIERNIVSGKYDACIAAIRAKS